MVTFNPTNHTYISDSNEQYISVTTLLKKLEQPKDWNEIAEKYAKKHGETAQYWQQKWKEKGEIAASRGTLIHNYFENKYYNEPQELPVLAAHTDDSSFKKSIELKNLEPGIYPELLIYSNKYKIAGQSDLVKIYSDKTFIIEDYKTDKVINFESGSYYSPKHKRSMKTMLSYPVNHLDECNWNKYQLQLSIYAFLLEQYGFKNKGLQINHIITDRDESDLIKLDSEGNPIILEINNYKCDYLKSEAKSILKTII